jgi:hypothetical protein
VGVLFGCGGRSIFCLVWWAGMHEVRIEHLLGSRNAPHHEGICGFDTNSKKRALFGTLFSVKKWAFLAFFVAFYPT